MMAIAEHLRHGRLHAAEAALADLPSDVEPGPNFSAAFAAQFFLLRRQQGRVGEFIPLFDLLAGDHTAPATWHAARIVALAETGEPSAGDLLRDAVARLGAVPRDWLWLATVTLLADACIGVGDQGTAAELYRRLSPHRDHTVDHRPRDRLARTSRRRALSRPPSTRLRHGDRNLVGADRRRLSRSPQGTRKRRRGCNQHHLFIKGEPP